MSMYIARRLMLATIACVRISVVTFIIIHLPPGPKPPVNGWARRTGHLCRRVVVDAGRGAPLLGWDGDYGAAR